jgi:myo-inositol-1(or 4)-monophosphatase
VCRSDRRHQQFRQWTAFFAISVALVRNRKSVLGVVYDPSADEAFLCRRRPGRVHERRSFAAETPPDELSRCMAGIELKRIDRTLAGRLAFEHPFSSQRNLGASTLDWCYIAAGACISICMAARNLWDYAAGCLILKEAGGAACALDGSEFRQ